MLMMPSRDRPVLPISPLLLGAPVSISSLLVCFGTSTDTCTYAKTLQTANYGMTLRLHSQAAQARSAQSKRELGCTGLQAQTCHAGGSCLSSLVTCAF